LFGDPEESDLSMDETWIDNVPQVFHEETSLKRGFFDGAQYSPGSRCFSCGVQSKFLGDNQVELDGSFWCYSHVGKLELFHINSIDRSTLLMFALIFSRKQLQSGLTQWPIMWFALLGLPLSNEYTFLMGW
jgi:hypothetical protein